MVVRQTSLDAYRGIKDEDSLGSRQAIVYNGFKEHGSHTNLEISVFLNIPINQVTPRTNELVKKGFLEEKQRRQCEISGRKAIVWGLKNNG